MLVLGLICLLIGFVLGVPIIWTIGIILAVVGAILLVVGAGGRELGGRRYWY